MFTEGLETDLTIDGVNYRVDAVVLEELDKDGEPINPIEKYSEIDYQTLLEHLTNNDSLLEIVEKLKTNNEKLRGVIGGLNE